MSDQGKGNGHDRVTEEMVGLLRDIRDGVQETNRRVESLERTVGGLERLANATNAHLDALHKLAIRTHEELGAFRTETRDELMGLKGEIHGTNERLDHLCDTTDQLGKAAEKTADRLDAMALDMQKLEARVVKLEGKPAPRPRARARR